MEHPVWKILNKEKYVEEFIPQTEQMYDFIKGLVNTAGNCTSSKNGNTVPVMKEFYDMWNEFGEETFCILGELVNRSKFACKEVSMRDLAAKIIDEYNFAKSQGFDSVSIVIESESGTYNVDEYYSDGEFQGFISDSFDCLYGDIEGIAEELSGHIDGEVYDIRIE